MNLFSLTYDIVGIAFSNSSMSLSVCRNNQNSLMLYAYQEYTFENNEIYNLRLYNISSIAEKISNFLIVFKIKYAFTLISLNGDYCEQLFSTATDKQLSYDYLWQQQEIVKDDLTYLVGIKHDLLFQYKLLALKANLNLAGITSDLIPFYYACKINNILPEMDSTFNIRTLKDSFKKNIEKQITLLLHNKDINISQENLALSLSLFYVGKAYYEAA